MTVAETCIRRPVMTTLLTLGLLFLGLFAYRLLPVAALPEVELPTIHVSASLPGASPESMASSVALPLEKEFSTIAGLESINSSNNRGETSITLQFSLDREIDAAALDVQTAISSALRRLPSEMTTPPSFRKVNPSNYPILYLALRSPTLPLSMVNEFAETRVGQRLATLPGVGQVQIYGRQKFAVRIRVDPDRLAASNLTLDDVRAAVAAANTNSPTGTLSGDTRSVTLEAHDQLSNAEDFRPLIIAWRKGAPVRLSDVAEVVDSVEGDKNANWYNGTRAVVLAIQRQPGANTVEVAERIRALMPQFRAQLPPSLDIGIVFDRSQSIHASVNDVQFTLVLAAVLVVLVIFLFLGSARATIIPGVVMPVSLIGTFCAMYLLGYGINNVSLLALTLAVGFVVDDAIVVLENIVRHVESGETVMEAALKGSREISFTIVSITLSLVAAFVPILFMGGLLGRLFREFAGTITVAILISGIVSLTLTPMMCSRFLRPGSGGEKGERPGPFARAVGRTFDAVQEKYRTSLDATLRHPRLMLLLTLSSLALAVAGFVLIPKGFLPTEDTGQISVATEAAEDISFPAMVEHQKAVADIIRGEPDVETVNSVVGAGGPNPNLSNGRMFVVLKPWAERSRSSPEIIQSLRKKVAQVPGITVYFQPVQNLTFGGRPSKSLYQYTLQAGTTEELYRWADEFLSRFKALPALQDVTSDLQIKSPMALVAIDRDKAAALGVSAEELRGVLFSAYGSRQVATIYTSSDSYAVLMEVGPEFQRETNELSRLRLRAGDGGLVPLDAVASVSRVPGPLAVNHMGQLPAVTLSFNLAPGVALGEAMEHISAVERALAPPASVSGTFQGTAQIFQQSLSNQGLLIAAALVLVYIVLGVLYESFVHPITILSGLPSAAVGALATLMLAGYELTVIATIGIILLIGI
ncbi:MAG: efflux RND transporter permease subunit, partial [Alphaproteobacteria bacterium]|nr:efflux RND transporter permease subunit [Alphaproteobacteria bacterium]